MATESQGPVLTPSAEIVGNAFVHQYYLILHQSPELVHRFYQDGSKLGRPDDNGGMSITTTMQAINEKILSLVYEDFSAEISTVDAQESYNRGVLVLVTGFLTGKDNVRRKFTQSFFLAPQDKGYFVLNDVFRYVVDAKVQIEHYIPVNEIEVPPQNQEPFPVLENHDTEQPVGSPDVVNGWEDDEFSEKVVVTVEKEEEPIPEVVEEIPEDLHTVSESNTKVEDTPRKSYASIVRVLTESFVSVTPAPTPSRSTVKSQEKQVTPLPPPPTTVVDTLVSDTNTVETGNNQESEAEGPSIYLKGLPSNITYEVMENEFKKFGTVRNTQIRSHKGFYFGFVEFDDAAAVQSALDASPVYVNGRRVVVEEKKSTYRAYHRGRPSSGSGNRYMNDNGGDRGVVRGNYNNGRGGYDGTRGDFGGGNRSDFSNRGGPGGGRGGGGYSNRGEGYGHQRDNGGYQRADGANGGRVNRPGGYAVNAAAAKGMAPRVSASA